MVNTELKLEGADFHKLPEVTAFACSIDGAIATFTRKLGNEEVMVTLDTAELDTTEDFVDDEDEAEEDSEMEVYSAIKGLFSPLVESDIKYSLISCSDVLQLLQFQSQSLRLVYYLCWISIPKENIIQGNLMQFECSFNVDYGEIQIDSVSVVPKDCEQADSVYYVDGSQLGKVH